MLISTNTFACKCETLDIKKSFENADFVFIGNIYSVQQTPSGFKTLQNFISSVKIEKIFKSDQFDGFYTDQATLFSSQIRSCDYPFNKTGKYLIFGYIDSDTGFVYSNICFATKELNLISSSDLKQLNQLSENFKQELKTKNSQPIVVKSLIEDSPDRIINDLKLKISTLESENSRLNIVTFVISGLFILSLIISVIKRKR